MAYLSHYLILERTKKPRRVFNHYDLFLGGIYTQKTMSMKRMEVLPAVSMKFTVFCVVTL
jgi:hypothetical protein